MSLRNFGRPGDPGYTQGVPPEAKQESRKLWRRAESLLGGLVTEMTEQHELPTPGWIFRPLDLVMAHGAQAS